MASCFFLSFFGQVFPNFQKMLMIVAVGRIGGSRTSLGQWRFSTPGIGLSKSDKKELGQFVLKGSFEIVMIRRSLLLLFNQ